MVKVKTAFVKEYDIPDEDIDVLVEMAGYGIGYWANSADSGVDGEYSVTWDEFETVEGVEMYVKHTHTATYEELAESLVEVASWDTYVGAYALDYFRGFELDGEGDAGYFDSDLADVVVQLALFGSVVYG